LNLDIRMPMGLMFLVVGAILTVFGALTCSDPMDAEHSLGYNVNLIWGAVLFAVGAIMVLLARKAAKKAPAA
jgi:ABC-type Fe3+-siderophore transport system permease subunit